MSLVVRTHRLLTDRLGRELEEAVGIPLVFFDVLIHVGAAPDGRLTMSRLSTDVALTTGGVTRLVDRMVDAGLVATGELPQRPPEHPCGADAGRTRTSWSAPPRRTPRASSATSSTPLSAADRAGLAAALDQGARGEPTLSRLRRAQSRAPLDRSGRR